jgi:hypothetical protein
MVDKKNNATINGNSIYSIPLNPRQYAKQGLRILKRKLFCSEKSKGWIDKDAYPRPSSIGTSEGVTYIAATPNNINAIINELK